MATGIFCCGAECGITDTLAGTGHWTAKSTTMPTADTVTKRTGARSWRCNPSAAESWLGQATGTVNIVVASFYVKFDTLPNGTTRLFTTTGNIATAAIEYNQTTSYLRAVLGTAKTDRVDVSGWVAGGLWHRIDLYINTSANPWTLDWQVDGTAYAQETNAAAADTFTAVRVGCGVLNNTTADMYLDDIYLSVTGGDYPIGAVEVIKLSPTGDGTHSINSDTDFLYDASGGVDNDPMATDTYQWVDDVPLALSGDRLTMNDAALNEYLEWTMADPGRSDDAYGVETIAGLVSEGAGNGYMDLILYDGTSTSKVFDNENISSTTPNHRSGHKALAPSGGAWTQALVNALRVRWAARSSRTADTSMYGLMAEVAYGPTPASSGIVPILLSQE